MELKNEIPLTDRSTLTYSFTRQNFPFEQQYFCIHIIRGITSRVFYTYHLSLGNTRFVYTPSFLVGSVLLMFRGSYLQFSVLCFLVGSVAHIFVPCCVFWWIPCCYLQFYVLFYYVSLQNTISLRQTNKDEYL